MRKEPPKAVGHPKAVAVGESKLEAVLYGVILWGLLFAGMFWLVASGVGAGFGGLVSGVLSMSSSDTGEFDPSRFSGLLKRFGADPATVDRYMADYRLVRNDPAANEQALAAQAVQLTPAAPMPPCPARNDRVGCVPDPQTRAKLHIH